jgi:hypothetical protein
MSRRANRRNRKKKAPRRPQKRRSPPKAQRGGRFRLRQGDGSWGPWRYPAWCNQRGEQP